MNNPQLAPEAEALASKAFENEGVREIGGPFWHELSERDQWRLVRMFEAGRRSAPGSTGAVAPEPVTPELRAKIEAVRAGCEGVTQGPWRWEGSIYEHMGAEIVAERGLAQLWQRENVVADAAHIARLDPDFVRQLCDLATHPLTAGARQSQGLEEALAGLLGNEDDPESLAHAFVIANMAAPARDYQGNLYCDLNADAYRDAEFRDYGLARAVRVLINNAARLRAVLLATHPASADTGQGGRVEELEAALRAAEVDLREAEDKFHVIHLNHPGKRCSAAQQQDKDFLAYMSGRMKAAADLARAALGAGART